MENQDGTVRKPECYEFPNGKLDSVPEWNLRQENLRTDLDYSKTYGYIQSVSGLTFIEHRPMRGNDQTVMMRLMGKIKKERNKLLIYKSKLDY